MKKKDGCFIGYFLPPHLRRERVEGEGSARKAGGEWGKRGEGSWESEKDPWFSTGILLSKKCIAQNDITLTVQYFTRQSLKYGCLHI